MCSSDLESACREFAIERGVPISAERVLLPEPVTGETLPGDHQNFGAHDGSEAITDRVADRQAQRTPT